MSSEWSEYFETITQFLVGASRQYGVANGSFTEYVVDRLDLCISSYVLHSRRADDNE